jgi:small subunit ribosomal protein S6e
LGIVRKTFKKPLLIILKEMKVNISDKSGKSYSKVLEKSEEKMFIGKRVGQVIKLDSIGLEGYEVEITGGSDKQGFPMRKSILGVKRKRALLKGGVGYKKARGGRKKRKNVRGNRIDGDVQQVNVKVVNKGKTKLDKILKKQENKEKAEK